MKKLRTWEEIHAAQKWIDTQSRILDKCMYAVIIAMLLQAVLCRASDDTDSYCKYITEQAMAQRDLLRVPNALVGPIQPSTGTPPQLVFGVTSTLAHQRQARLTMQAAEASCELYRTSTEAQRRIYYALPGIEKDVLKNRLALIQATADKMDAMMVDQSKQVDAQNLTRPALYSIQAAKVRLDQSRAMALSGITSPYVPPLSKTPLRELVAEKGVADKAASMAQAKLNKLNDWDLSFTGGVHHQLHNPTQAVGPYAEAQLTYNLGSRSINKHLDNSVAAYTEWKTAQENDVVQQAKILESQVVDTIALDEGQLKVLVDQDKELDSEIAAVANLDTSAAVGFRNQLMGDQLILRVDIDDMQFRLVLLRQYLIDNF